MSRYEYKIGTSVALLKSVDTLGTNVKKPVEPQGLAIEPFSVYRTAANGVEYGDGYPRTEWRFDAIGQAQLTGILAYLGSAQSATVYIRTRKADRSYGNYKAVMHRPKPDEMAPAFSSMWHDVTIRFTMLEAQ